MNALQSRFARALNRRASVTFRERVAREDRERHEKNGITPEPLEDLVFDLDHRVSKLEERIG